ncbi:unnamed protein product [Cercospora beticola]|nr:unnamed protein product [Cercospora beticola]
MVRNRLVILFLLLLPFGLGSPLDENTEIGAQNRNKLNDFLSKRQQAGSCTLNCFTKVLPQFNCPDLLQCICNDKAVAAALQQCAVESGCSIEEALQGQKAQAETCGFPKRNRVMVFTVTQTALFTLASVCAILRLLARGKTFGGAGYGWDDAMLFASCLPMLGLTVVGYMEQMAGLGRDIWELEFEQIENVLKLFYIGNTFYSPVVFGTKMAFVLLYLRIWKDSSIVFRRICQVILVLLAMATIGFTFSTIFLCQPVSYTWKALSGLKGTCVNRNAQLYSNSAVNIAMDVIVLLLPVRKILQLRMTWPKKIGLLFTFLVGFVTTATSVIQFYYLITRLNSTQNPTWDYFDIGVWRITEMYLGVVCCCMPMIAGLVKRSVQRASQAVSFPSTVSEMWSKTKNLMTTTTTSSKSRMDPKLTANVTLTGSLGLNSSWLHLKADNTPASEQSVELRNFTTRNIGDSIGDHPEGSQPTRDGHVSAMSDATTAVTSNGPLSLSTTRNRDSAVRQQQWELYQKEHPVRSKSRTRRRGYSLPHREQNIMSLSSPYEDMKSRISRIDPGEPSFPATVARQGAFSNYVDRAAGADHPSRPPRPGRPRADTMPTPSPAPSSSHSHRGSRIALQIPSASHRYGGLESNNGVWTALPPVMPSPMSDDSQEMSVTSDEILSWARRSQQQALQRYQPSVLQEANAQRHPDWEERRRLEVRSYSDRALPSPPSSWASGGRRG